MGYRVDDRTILITGASTGIGAALAQQLGTRARQLVLVARTKEKLDALAERISVSTRVVVADLSTVEGVRSLLGAVSDLEIDILINNAGAGLAGLFDRVDEDRYLHVVQLNVTALTQLTRGLLPGMLERGHGAILNVSSIVAFQDVPYMTVYAATKAYVNQLTASLAAEVVGRGVTIAALCPGTTRTEFFDAAGIDATVQLKTSMSADDVARDGIAQIERGRLFRICGWYNRLMVGLARWTPRPLQNAVARRMLSNFAEK